MGDYEPRGYNGGRVTCEAGVADGLDKHGYRGTGLINVKYKTYRLRENDSVKKGLLGCLS